jgi:hypothetical protein
VIPVLQPTPLYITGQLTGSVPGGAGTYSLNVAPTSVGASTFVGNVTILRVGLGGNSNWNSSNTAILTTGMTCLFDTHKQLHHL